MRIHGTGVVYRFQDVVTKGDADDNRDVIVHMDSVNHFGGPFLSGVQATSLSLAVPMTRHQRKVDRDFSSINIENTYNVRAVCTHVLATAETSLLLSRFDYSQRVIRNTKSGCFMSHNFVNAPGVPQNGT